MATDMSSAGGTTAEGKPTARHEHQTEKIRTTANTQQLRKYDSCNDIHKPVPPHDMLPREAPALPIPPLPICAPH